MKANPKVRKGAEVSTLGTYVQPANQANSHGRTIFIVSTKPGSALENRRPARTTFVQIGEVAQIWIGGRRGCPACLIKCFTDAERRRSRREA